jgi:hypothetical protein
MTLSAPVWIVALVLAACAPWVVRVVADRIEARVRLRTEALVARARRAASATSAADRVTAASSSSHDAHASHAIETFRGSPPFKGELEADLEAEGRANG